MLPAGASGSNRAARVEVSSASREELVAGGANSANLLFGGVVPTGGLSSSGRFDFASRARAAALTAPVPDCVEAKSKFDGAARKSPDDLLLISVSIAARSME